MKLLICLMLANLITVSCVETKASAGAHTSFYVNGIHCIGNANAISCNF